MWCEQWNRDIQGLINRGNTRKEMDWEIGMRKSTKEMQGNEENGKEKTQGRAQWTEKTDRIQTKRDNKHTFWTFLQAARHLSNTASASEKSIPMNFSIILSSCRVWHQLSGPSMMTDRTPSCLACTTQRQLASLHAIWTAHTAQPAFWFAAAKTEAQHTQSGVGR